MVWFSEILARTIKFLLFCYFIYQLGFIKAIVAYFICQIFYNQVIYYLFGLTDITPHESLFAHLPSDYKYTLTGYFVLDSYKPESIKSLIVEKGIKKFNRLRHKLTYFLGYQYWKEYSVEDALNQVVILPQINLESEDDIIEYSLKQQAIPFKANEFHTNFNYYVTGKKSV